MKTNGDSKSKQEVNQKKSTGTTPLANSKKNKKNASTPGASQKGKTGKSIATTPLTVSSKRKKQKKNGEKSLKGVNTKTSKIMEKHQFKEGEEIEGVNTYKVVSQVRKTTRFYGSDVYIIKEPESDDVYRLKTSYLDYGILKKEASILQKVVKQPGTSHFPTLIEYGSIAKSKTEYVILSPYGITLDDVMKKVINGPFTPSCAFNIGLQMLKAIKDLHCSGFLHRNISPASFNVGLGENDKKVLLTDFRAHRKWQDNAKAHVVARPKVKKYGNTRFASRACLLEKDQGRKDDLEGWLYTFFYLVDNSSLTWKKETDMAKIINKKESFMKSEEKEAFEKMPEDMKKVVAIVASLKYEDEPDYEAINTKLADIQKEKEYDTSAIDWKDKSGIDGVYEGETAKSVDNRISGEGDIPLVDKVAKKSKKTQRKKLSSGDVIRTQGKNSWKVLTLLGSGGFGDVYKVSREGAHLDKCYALKTEGEDGDKRLLRLKVEVTVMMKTSEGRDSKKFEHFIEFIDRGRCEDLKCKFVVMGLVGPSIDDIRKKYILGQFSKNTCFNIAIQTVDAVRDLHSLGYLHRDIKPANYAVGLNETESVIYMLDFGICKLYRGPDGTHKTPRVKVKFLGTLRYAARACMKQIEQGRKDDLECWIYMVFELLEDDSIPWRRIAEPRKILQSKEKFFAVDPSNPQYPKRVPKGMAALVRYIGGLEYESAPDYEYINNFLRTCAKDNGIKPDKKLDWIGKLKKKAFESESEKSEKKQQSGEDSG